jgi:hypothetical protein
MRRSRADRDETTDDVGVKRGVSVLLSGTRTRSELTAFANGVMTRQHKEMTVGLETIDPASGQNKLTLEPQKRPMTVEDLVLCDTTGLVYFDKNNIAVHKAGGCAPTFEPKPGVVDQVQTIRSVISR